MTPEINQDTPEISVVIPARNEEKYLPKCLKALQVAAQRAEMSFECVVVLNNCTDRTEEIALNFGCSTVICNEKNLAAIRNHGVQQCRAAWIVTVDADSFVSENMFQLVRSELQNGRSIAGGVLILPERWSLGILLTGLCLMPLVFFEQISAGLFFFQRSAFDAIGGFDESYVSVEDIDFARRLKRYAKSQGKRFATLWRAHIITSTRKFDRFGDWYFLKNPKLFWKLLHNRDHQAAQKIWYDFER